MAGTNFNITVVHKNGTGVYNISTTSTTFQDLLETVQSGIFIMGDIKKLSGNNGTGDEVGFSLTEGGNAVDLNASINTTVGGNDTTIYALYPEPSAEKVTGFYLDGTKYELGGGVTSVNGQTGNVTIETFQLAPNSPLNPKYRRYGTQAQYEALTQYYTDNPGDTVYFTI